MIIPWWGFATSLLAMAFLGAGIVLTAFWMENKK